MKRFLPKFEIVRNSDKDKTRVTFSPPMTRRPECTYDPPPPPGNPPKCKPKGDS